MSKEQVMNYVMNSPANTNPNVLSGMLDGISGTQLPSPTPSDNDKVLGVKNGSYALMYSKGLAEFHHFTGTNGQSYFWRRLKLPSDGSDYIEIILDAVVLHAGSTNIALEYDEADGFAVSNLSPYWGVLMIANGTPSYNAEITSLRMQELVRVGQATFGFASSLVASENERTLFGTFICKA